MLILITAGPSDPPELVVTGSETDAGQDIPRSMFLGYLYANETSDPEALLQVRRDIMAHLVATEQATFEQISTFAYLLP